MLCWWPLNCIRWLWAAFATRFDLCHDFALDAAGQRQFVLFQELGDGSAVPLNERPKSPGKAFDDHILSVRNDLLADCESPINISCASSCPHVKGDCADDSQPTLPPIRRTEPTMNQPRGNPPFAPGWSSNVASERIDAPPVVKPASEKLNRFRCECADRCRVRRNQFVRGQASARNLIDQFKSDLDYFAPELRL